MFESASARRRSPHSITMVHYSKSLRYRSFHREMNDGEPTLADQAP
jgi:hypothetical protein